jgi:membrane protease YdiL (CAAX protease family)
MWVNLIGLSIFALLILRFFPGNWITHENHVNATVGFIAVAVIFYMAIYLMGLPTLKYFGLPKFRLKALFAMALVFPAPILQILSSDLEDLSWQKLVGGIVFLFAIGFGEEMLSRGFIFGALVKFGQLKAIFFSSLLFGLMHINVYIPGYLGWGTYSHVMSAFGFGMIMCALMIVTRTIWAPILLHTMANWQILFEKEPAPFTDSEVYSLWDNVSLPFLGLAFEVVITLILLGINRARMPSMPKWFWRIVLKLKLIDPEHTASQKFMWRG